MTDLEILQELKDRYEKHQVSLLVGSGFTKNAFSSSPTWSELLYDLVTVAYSDELNERYANYIHQNLGKPKTKGNKFKEWISIIVKRDGYLKVVSKYIEVKGHREAIDVYIESHNPYVYDDGAKISVDCNGNKYSINDQDLETHLSLLKCKWVNIFTTNFDNFLEYTSRRNGLKYQKIIKDYQLSQKSDKDIIKIHGDLVKPSESLISPFEFDNDHSRRYIISEDDFETYRTKHEAFSYYLRTALLTGCYCLVGFSGDDPNYKGWLNWVKDILDKKLGQNLDDPKEIKVFLISFNKKSLPLEQEIYNRNHHISIIHLSDPDVAKEIKASNLSPDDYSGYLCSFFEYLRNSVLTQERNITSLLGDAAGNIGNSDAMKEIYDAIVKITKDRPLQFVHNYAVAMFIEHFMMFKEIPDDNAQNIFIIAVHYGGILPFMLYNGITDKLRTVKDQWYDMLQRQQLFYLEHDFGNIDFDNNEYYQILDDLVNLDFKKAKTHVLSWKTTEIDNIKKASILALLTDRKEAANIIKSSFKDIQSLQMRYVASLLYNLCEDWTSRIRLTEYNGIIGYTEIVRHIIEHSQNPSESYTEYGAFVQQFNLNKEQRPLQEGIKYLQLIIDSGIFPRYGLESIIKIEDWYTIFRNIYTIAPDFCFFVSILYNNRHTQKRIGEDYAYTDSFQDSVLPAVINRVQKAIHDSLTPIQPLIGILQTSYPLYVSAKEEDWVNDYLKILSDVLVNDKDKYMYSPSLRIYAKEVAKLVNTHDNICQCLTLFLRSMLNSVRDLSDLIPVGLQINRIETLTDEQLYILLEIGEKFPLYEKVYVYDWLYQSNLLPNVILDKIRQEEWSDDELSKLDNQGLLAFAILYDAKGESTSLIKQKILSSNIWNTGFHSGAYIYEDYFHFNSLPDSYKWTKQELDIIEHNLEKNLEELINPLRILYQNASFRLVSIIEDMEDFMKKYFTDDRHRSVQNKITSILNELRDWSNIDEGLHHSSNEKILLAINKLYDVTRKESFGKYEKYFKEVLEITFHKKGYVLTSALSYVFYVVSNKTGNVVEYDEYKNKLTWLLQIFAKQDLRNFDVDVVRSTFYLSRIANILKDYGVKDPSIDYWSERSNRYNFTYIEYLLK